MKKVERENMEALVKSLEELNEIDDHIQCLYDTREHYSEKIVALKKQLEIE